MHVSEKPEAFAIIPETGIDAPWPRVRGTYAAEATQPPYSSASLKRPSSPETQSGYRGHFWRGTNTLVCEPSLHRELPS